MGQVRATPVGDPEAPDCRITIAIIIRRFQHAVSDSGLPTRPMRRKQPLLVPSLIRAATPPPWDTAAQKLQRPLWAPSRRRWRLLA